MNAVTLKEPDIAKIGKSIKILTIAAIVLRAIGILTRIEYMAGYDLILSLLAFVPAIYFLVYIGKKNYGQGKIAKFLPFVYGFIAAQCLLSFVSLLMLNNYEYEAARYSSIGSLISTLAYFILLTCVTVKIRNKTARPTLIRVASILLLIDSALSTFLALINVIIYGYFTSVLPSIATLLFHIALVIFTSKLTVEGEEVKVATVKAPQKAPTQSKPTATVASGITNLGAKVSGIFNGKKQQTGGYDPSEAVYYDTSSEEYEF